MAGNNQQDENWRRSTFRFEVDFAPDLKNVAFQLVSGMDTENQIIDYRQKDSPHFSTIKTPGISKYGNVTLKRGLFIDNAAFWNWRNQVVMNTVAKQKISIRLVDYMGTVTAEWILNNAWPIKITGPDLPSDGNEIVIEAIEIAYEELIIANRK